MRASKQTHVVCVPFRRAVPIDAEVLDVIGAVAASDAALVDTPEVVV